MYSQIELATVALDCRYELTTRQRRLSAVGPDDDEEVGVQGSRGDAASPRFSFKLRSLILSALSLKLQASSSLWQPGYPQPDTFLAHEVWKVLSMGHELYPHLLEDVQ